MKYIPKGLTRLVGRQLLKLNAKSPTIMVVSGVIGLSATAVLAAKASRHLDPVVESHQKARQQLDEVSFDSPRAEQTALVKVYGETTLELAKLYGPTLCLGTVSIASILYGHKVLHGRHLATLAAYSGLMEQFQAYRQRVVKTLGEPAERDIYNGAHGEWQEDPDHKGEYKLSPVFGAGDDASYLRPWFDEVNCNWTKNPQSNYLFLKGVQQHMNNLLQIRGHVFLNDVYDALYIPRTQEGSVAGWIRDSSGDNYIDFGFMTDQSPQTIAFRNFMEPRVRLNFNIDGVIWNLI